MRVSRRLLVLIVIAFTLTSTLPVRGAEPTRAPVGVDASLVAKLIAASGPVAVTGQLLDARGNPTRGTIEAFAWPTEAVYSKIKVGESIERVPVAAAVAGPSGVFNLRLDRASLGRDYVSAGGQVDLELIAWSASDQRTWFTSVQSSTFGGASIWLSPTDRRSSTGGRTTSTGVSATIRLTDPLKVAAAVDGGTIAIPVCTAPILISTHNVMVRIGRSMNNESGQTSWMKDGTSHSVTLGVAVSYQSTVGFSASGTATTTSGVEFTWASSSSDRMYYRQVQYGKNRFTCAGVTQYSFRPRQPTGGNNAILTSFNPSWSNCAPVSAGTWVRSRTDGNTTAFSGGVESAGHIGINLSFNSNYSSTRTLNYKLTQSGRVCGSNNLPAYASEVEAES
jgi:hypothetical protein